MNEPQEPQWQIDYRKANPLPVFTHWGGWWMADGKPIMQTQSMGKTFPLNNETPLEEVPEYVVGAYCGINRLCWGNFMMCHAHYKRREYGQNV